MRDPAGPAEPRGENTMGPPWEAPNFRKLSGCYLFDKLSFMIRFLVLLEKI